VTSEINSNRAETIFVGDSEMALLMRTHDWTQTPLGPVETWPQSLQTTVSLCLESPSPIVIWWGDHWTLLYNDACKPILGSTKHPRALGRSGREFWAEIWNVIEPQLTQVFMTGQATWCEDLLLMMERSGYLEETYFTYSYSPIRLETGEVGGVFAALTETTRRFLSERRLKTLSDLAAQAAQAKTAEQACQLAIQILAENPADIPFALLYLLTPDGKQAQLCRCTSLEVDAIVSPSWVDLALDGEGLDHWSLASVVKTGQTKIIDNLAQRFGALPSGPWQVHPQQALVLPLRAAGQQQLAGLLVVAVNPHRALDNDFRNFFGMAAGQIATAIANARAYEEERKRAEALAELECAKTTFFSNVSHEFDPLEETLEANLKLAQLRQEATQREQALRLEAEAERRQAEEALRQREEQFRKLADAMPQIVWIADAEGRPEYVNQRWVEYTGLTLAQTADQNQITQVIHPDDLKPTYRIWQGCLETGKLYQTEFRLKQASVDQSDNAYRWFLCRAVPIQNQQGQIAHWYGTLTDLHDRKQMEEALRRSEERLRVSQELSLDAFTILDSIRNEAGLIVDFVWTYVNPKAAEILQHPVEELVGQRLLDLLPGNQLNSELFQRYVQVVETGEPHDIELSYNADGINGWFRNMTVKLEDGVAIFFSDITERKQTEQALRNAEERLRVALQNAPITVFSQDRELKYTWIHNPILYDLHEMLGKCDRDFLPPEDAEPLTAIKQQVLETGIGVREEIKIKRERTNYYDLTVEPLRDSNNTVIGIICAAVDISELKQTAINLRESEERLRLAMEGAQMGTWDVNLITGKAIWSELHFTMLGYEPTPTGEATEAMWSNRIHPDDVARVIKEWQQSRQERRLYRSEYRVIRADNQQVAWLTGLGSFIYNPSGEAIRSIGVLFDITERKQAEATLADQEQRYRYIFEAVNVPIWEEDFSEVKAAIEQIKASGIQDFCQYFAEHPEFVHQAVNMVRLRDVNHAALRMFNATDKAELLTSLHQIFVPETQEAFIKELLTIAAEEPFFAAETMLQTLQGDLLHVWVTITFPSYSESYERVLVSLLDISARVRAERQLRESEERLRLATEAADIYSWELDLKTQTATVSDNFATVVGCQLSDFPMKKDNAMTKFVHPEDVSLLSQAVAKAIAADGKLRLEYRFLNPENKAILWVESIGSVLYDINGTPVQMIGITQNVSDRKQAEAEREQLLAREQEAREVAEAANRIKDEFLAVVSHELRSPLNPILGWSKLLRDRQLDEQKTDRALEVIERNAQMQAQLINDLLDVSRILRGKLSLNISPVDLVFTIQAAMETVRLAAVAKSIEIHTLLDPQVGYVSGDSGRLQQVIWNLLSNAVKFTSSGGRVDIRLERIDSQAQITVSDTGKGIHPDFLPYVFDHFRQESAATTRRFGGLGLGLAIVRYLVELHGGTVQADSLGEGQGATFTVKLPLMPHQPMTNQDTTKPSEPSLDLHGIRILVVDDDDNTREFLAFLLELHRANVIAVSTASEAMTTLTQFKPDVLLSDIGMPDVDGYMLMRQVRALPPEQGGTIPAIALTAYAGEIDYQQAMAAGFQRHIAKPIEPQVLIQAIAELGLNGI
jgi:PAS domain S-box-containing protein